MMPDIKMSYNKLLALFALFFLGVVIYSNTFRNSFHWDDIAFILNNPAITVLEKPAEIFRYWPSRFVGFFTFAVNYRVHQFNVFGYHLVNIVAHILTAFLAYWFVCLTFSTAIIKKDAIYRYKEFVSFFAAAVFLAHPVQTEAVNYIFQRVTILAALFYLASLCLYIKALLPLEESGRINKPYFFFSFLAAVTGMLAKENAVTLPLMILIYDFYFLRFKRSINWKYVLPFFILLPIIPLTVCIAKPIVFTDVNRLLADPIASSISYFCTQFRVLITYLRLFLFPIGQNLDYDYSIARGFWEIPVMVSFLILVSIFSFGIRMFSRYRLVSFGVIWFFITLLPESSVIPLLDPIFEHRLYLPLVGCSIIAVSAISYLLNGKKNNIVLVILLLIIAVCSGLTYKRNRVWENEISLWSDVISKSPGKIRPYNERGIAYSANGDYDAAIIDFSRAVEINRNYADGFFNRGVAFQTKKELTKAILDYSEAIRIAPNSLKAHINRGVAYYSNKEYEKAVSDFKRAIEVSPSDTMAYFHLANLYGNLGKNEQAIELYMEILKINSKNAAAYYKLGSLYNSIGKKRKAIDFLKKTIDLAPTLAAAYNDLAEAYYYEKQFGLAIENCDKAIQLGYKVKPEFQELLRPYRK